MNTVSVVFSSRFGDLIFDIPDAGFRELVAEEGE